MRDQVRPGPLDQHRHLVRDHPRVRVRRAERREAAPLAGRDDEQQPVLKLDDRLPDAADLEALAGARRQALQGRGDRREVLPPAPG